MVVKMGMGSKLAKLRELAKMKQKDVAKALGVGRPAVSAWEVGRRMPSHRHLVGLAKLYGVPADYLVSEIDLTDVTGTGVNESADRSLDYVGVMYLPIYESVGPGSGGLAHSRIVDQEVVALDEVSDGHYFYFRVPGDAMGGRITKGDLALIKEGDQGIADGDVVLASVGADDAILRRYRRAGAPAGMVILQADNPQYGPTLVASENLHIIGKAVWFKIRG